MLRHATSCYAMLCYALHRHAKQCQAMPCFAMLHHATPWHGSAVLSDAVLVLAVLDGAMQCLTDSQQSPR